MFLMVLDNLTPITLTMDSTICLSQIFVFKIFHFPLFNFIQPVQNIWNTPTFTTNSNVDTFSKSSPLDNYNSSKGNLLVTIAENRAVGEVGYCAKFVQEAISLAGFRFLHRSARL